jgi:carotenoid cleavage dioxygenase-like enzyme
MRVPIKGAFGNVTLTGTGSGMVKLGPLSARETWYPANAHVSANIGQVTNEAQCIIYVGTSVEANNFRDGTLSGSSGDSTDAISADIVPMGEYIFAVWSGGDAGAIATLTVSGEKEV